MLDLGSNNYCSYPHGIYVYTLQVEDLDCIIAAVGGGGMISGISVAAKVMITITKLCAL